MIQIDDAGISALCLGVVIMAYRVETGKFVWLEVPVEMFQGDNFSRRVYRQGVVDATTEIISRLHHTPEKPIEICRGDIFTGVTAVFTERGYSFQAVKIEGPLRERVEMQFLANMHRIGITDVTYKIMTEKRPQFFFRVLRWLKGGNINGIVLPGRERYAKTGFLTYPFFASMPYKEALEAAKKAKAKRKRLLREARFLRSK